MTDARSTSPVDLAEWLRRRAERRGQQGIVAGYVHELSDRHRRSQSGAAPDGAYAEDGEGGPTKGAA